MFDSPGRRALPVLLTGLLTVSGCGDSDKILAGSSAPTGTTLTTPSNPPPSGVAIITGPWSGTSDFQQNGIRYISNFTGDITQIDRHVEGTVRFTSPGWEEWVGRFNGTLAGTQPDTQFVGTLTLQSNSATGTGICSGQTIMAGPSRARSMRWEAPHITLSSNVSSQPPSACRGQVFAIIWIFFR